MLFPVSYRMGKIATYMNLTLRPGTPEDAQVCGIVLYEAFRSIADQHNYPHDFPTIERATAVMEMLLEHPGYYSVLAERDGRIVGGNFMDERSTVAGIGPIFVDPSEMNATIGRQLMAAVLERVQERNFPGVRLVQMAWHFRSLALYTKLGFQTRETLSALNGEPLSLQVPGYKVRPATAEDMPECNSLYMRVHGHERAGDLVDAVRQQSARVVERHGRITGYATGIGFFHHAVAETNDDLKAMIGAAETILGFGVLVPSRNTDLFRWCLDRGLRINQQCTLMSIGLYNEPQGAYLPSVIY